MIAHNNEDKRGLYSGQDIVGPSGKAFHHLSTSKASKEGVEKKN